MTTSASTLDVAALLRADAAKNTSDDNLFVVRVMLRVAMQQALQAENLATVALLGASRPPNTWQLVARAAPWLVMGGLMATSVWWASPATAVGPDGLASWAWAGAAALVAWAMLAPWPTLAVPPDRSAGASD
jgi:hypothetical protein